VTFTDGCRQHLKVDLATGKAKRVGEFPRHFAFLLRSIVENHVIVDPAVHRFRFGNLMISTSAANQPARTLL
jgi:hypothetical protein